MLKSNNIIKIPTYKDVSINTLINAIPDIINYNNSENMQFINSVCNTDKNFVKISLNTDGFVKAGTGEFLNLKFNTLDASTENNSFKNIVTNHNKSFNRFKDEKLNDNNNYAHDAQIIYYDSTHNLYDKISYIDSNLVSLKDKNDAIIKRLNNIENHINALYDNLNINKNISEYADSNNYILNDSVMKSMRSNIAPTTLIQDASFVDVYNTSANSYTYPNTAYLNGTYTKYVYKYDKYDIENGNKFRYYKCDSNTPYLKINNQYKCALNTTEVGREITLIINKMTNDDLYIKLSSNENGYKFVKILSNDIDLARITLICVGIDDIYGPIWYIKNYNGNLILE